MTPPDAPPPVFWSPHWHAFFTGFFTEQRTAVLATAREDQPYCSLMAFAWLDGDPRQLVMASPSHSEKMTNIEHNPKVSLLIDSSRNAPEDSHTAKAVTVLGTARICPAGDQDRAAAALSERHPHLASFIQDPGTALLCVSAHRLLLVEHFQDVTLIETGITDQE